MASPPTNASDMSTSSAVLDSFTRSADTYERRIGRATRAIAAHIATVTLAGLPSEPAVHDNACGTGAFTDELLKVRPGARVDATDAAGPMVELLDARMRSAGRAERVQAAVMDAAALRFEDERFDASVTNFGIFFLAEPGLGVREIWRTVRPGGVAVLTCWATLDLVWGVFAGIEEVVGPARPFVRPDFLRRWTDRATMEGYLKEAGFAEVEMVVVKALLWGHDVHDLAGCLSENMIGFIGDEYTSDEKDRCFEAAKTFLEGKGKTMVAHEDSKVGIRMSAWVAKAVK